MKKDNIAYNNLKKKNISKRIMQVILGLTSIFQYIQLIWESLMEQLTCTMDLLIVKNIQRVFLCWIAIYGFIVAYG